MCIVTITCNTHSASKLLKTTQKAHFGPFRMSTVAITRPRKGQNTLSTPRTYPKKLQIPPTYIATSHMLYSLGLKIAQNRWKPLKTPILGLSGRVIWLLSGPVRAKTHSARLKHTQICSRYHQHALLLDLSKGGFQNGHFWKHLWTGFADLISKWPFSKPPLDRIWPGLGGE